MFISGSKQCVTNIVSVRSIVPHTPDPSENLNVANPDARPVTTPEAFTTAILGWLLIQTPPEVGDKVVVKPAQIICEPVIPTTGAALTVTGAEATLIHCVAVAVNVNATVPVLKPVTMPPSLIVATAGLLLAQVPPEDGDKLVVVPTHIVLIPVMTATGLGCTVSIADGAEAHPVAVDVNVNLAVPWDTPVTIPPLVMVAMVLLVLAQVPPEFGDMVVVLPTQIGLRPVMETTGLAFTAINIVSTEVHPVDVSVNINPAVPADTPCTNPVLVTVATPGLRLVQLPPIVGATIVVAPAHTVVGPVVFTAGLLWTVIGDDAFELHPVFVSVNVNVTVPGDTPVMMPPSVIVATEGLLLTHWPPDDGKIDVVPPLQMEDGPFMVTAGFPFTDTWRFPEELQPVPAVYINVVIPLEIPVTTPLLLIVATFVLLLDHVPLPDGRTLVNPPSHIVDGPSNSVIGLSLTVIGKVASDIQPVDDSVK